MRLISLFFILLVAQLVAGQTVDRVPEIFSKRLISSDLNGVEVRYDVPVFSRSQVKVGDRPFDYIHIPGIGKMREPGKPALPATTELVALPFHAGFALASSSDGYTDHTGFMVHPALQPAFDTYGAPEPEFEIDSLLYQTNDFFPQNLAEVADTLWIRGIRVLVLRVFPVQFNPVTGVVRVHTSIRVNAAFSGSGRTFEPAGTENSIHFTKYLSGLLLNGAQLPEGIQGQPALSPDYLIVTIDPFLAAADSIALWRQQMGFRTEIISQPAWTTQQIKDSVHNRYYNSLPRPDYLLIIGDHNHVPAEMFPSGSSSYPTDLYYVCMDGSADFYPDMAKGRISVTGPTDAMSIVQKIINYERNPVTDSAFYTNSLHCAQFQDDDTSGFATRRFAHTSEEIRDYILGKGFSVQRIYYTYSYVTPTNYNNGYYSNGEPLPPDLLKSNGFLWNGGETQIAQAINSGRFYVLHRDHGYVGGSGWAHPYFTKTSMNMLSNGNKLPVVFSINCHTGEFSLTECFAERFLRLPAGGAAGVVGASFASYSGYNDALSVGMFDGIWNNPGLLPLFGSGGIANPSTSQHPPILAMGDVMNHGLLRMVQTWNGSNSANIYQYRLFHYFGDPAMRMFTAAPQQITAIVPDTIAAGSTQLTVTGCNVQDALATVVYQNELMASANIPNGNTILSFQPLNDTLPRALVTISRHNYRPFLKEVVIAGQSPALNNEPCSAIEVPVKRFCDPVPASFAGALPSTVTTPSCATQSGRDIWFSFMAPGSGRVEVELGDAMGAAGLATYSSACSVPVYLTCSTTADSSGRVVIPMNSLTPGDTILVRIWEIAPGTSTPFYLCIRETDTFPIAQ
ncbi:MAG: C25 family cysteine peptidase, partial [Bacteroidales bacterium]